MGRLSFYKRDPQAFIDGVEGMTLEEIGAYTLIIDHMYARGGAVMDSPAVICGMLNIDRRVWKRLRQSLVMKGKIVDTGDGFLTNRRVEQELTWLEDVRQARVKAGSTGGQLSAKRRIKSLENNEQAEANAQASDQAKSNQIKKKNSSVASKEAPELFSSASNEASEKAPKAEVVQLRKPLPVAVAWDDYRRTAQANGWPVPRALSEARRKRIESMLRKHGLDAWREALAVAAGDAWINDVAERGGKFQNWEMNVQYFTTEENFLRLLEKETARGERVDWTARYEYFERRGVWHAERGWGPPPGDAAHEGPRNAIEQRSAT